jgi:hypothetical protein
MNRHHPGAPRPARLLRWLAALATAALLTACGGGGDGSTDTRPEFAMLPGGQACGGGCGGDSGDGSGVGSGADGGDGAGGGLGEMRNVKVTARRPDGTVLATANLQNNLVSIYPGRYSGNAFILEFADDGSGRGEYYDEGLRAWTPMGAAKLRILVPDLTHHVSANPLAEAAYQWAINKWGNEGALNAARMTEANNTVRDAFNLRTPREYRVTDVTNYAVAVSDTTLANSLPNTHAGRMGTLMAAVPRAALRFTPSLGSPALAFLRQLAKDVQDDSSVNSSVQDADTVAYDVELPNTLSAAVSDARGEYGAPAQPGPTSAPSQCFNPALYADGTTYSITYDVFDGVEGTTRSSFNAALTGGATFNGTNNLLRLRVDLGDGSLIDSFAGADLRDGILNYGDVLSFLGQDRTTWTLTTLYDQPYLDPIFLLTPDSSATVSYTGTVTLRDGSGAVVGSPSRAASSKQVYFFGYETVSVPAGTFVSACRYESRDATSLTIDWYPSSGQGVPVLTEVYDIETGSLVESSSLVSGSVNGVPILGSSNQFRTSAR